MNLQAISEFLDVVQNPDKYQKALTALKTEQGKLETLIATVGKVSEITKVREQTSKILDEAQKTLEDARKTAEETVHKAGDTYKKKLDAVTKREVDVQAQVQKALELNTESKRIQESFAATSKELTRREAIVLDREQKAVKLEQELNERLEKLRTVMGG